jgi:hypothetical protein
VVSWGPGMCKAVFLFIFWGILGFIAFWICSWICRLLSQIVRSCLQTNLRVFATFCVGVVALACWAYFG